MQKRTCRVCSSTYDYPTPKSIATRFYCEECVEIPVATRRVLEALRRKNDRMSTRIEKLESELASAKGQASES